MANHPQLETIENAAHKNTLEDLNKIRKAISDCGALEAAKSHSREHADLSKKLISKTNMSQEVKDLISLTRGGQDSRVPLISNPFPDL
jgi:geranylgeranyl pyrophosphate synthase